MVQFRRPASSRFEEKYSGCVSKYRFRRFLTRMRAKASGDLERGAAIINGDVDRPRFASSPWSVSEDADDALIPSRRQCGVIP